MLSSIAYSETFNYYPEAYSTCSVPSRVAKQGFAFRRMVLRPSDSLLPSRTALDQCLSLLFRLSRSCLLHHPWGTAAAWCQMRFHYEMHRATDVVAHVCIEAITVPTCRSASLPHPLTAHHYLATLASAFLLAAQRARTAAPIRFLASADILCPLRALVFVPGLGEG